jgi:hypothetical protein
MQTIQRIALDVVPSPSELSYFLLAKKRLRAFLGFPKAWSVLLLAP